VLTLPPEEVVVVVVEMRVDEDPLLVVVELGVIGGLALVDDPPTPTQT
jgi:hypothetical protein